MNTQPTSTTQRAQPTSKWNIEVGRARVTLLNHLLLTAVAIGFVGLVCLLVAFMTNQSTQRLVPAGIFVFGWLATLIAWVWRNIRHHTRTLTLLLVVYVLGIILFIQEGTRGSGLVWLSLPPVLAFVLLGTRAMLFSGAVSILTCGLLSLACAAGRLPEQWIILPIVGPSAATSLSIEGGFFLTSIVSLILVLRSFGQSWSRTLTGASADSSRFRAQTLDLEETIARLRRQTAQLHATADIAHAGSSILDPEELLGQSVHRIQEGFSQSGVYYVGLFLLNEAQRVAVLRAATGEAGRLLLEMGYNVDLGDTSTVARCITHRQARISSNAREGTLRFDALAMPHARSEIALPLRSRGRILGALSMASTQDDAFSEGDIAVLQTMADQVAVAIDNAVLYSQTKTALEQLQAVQQRYMAQAWSEFLATRPVAVIDYMRPEAQPVSGEFLRDARRAAVAHERTVATSSLPPDDDGNSAAPDDDENSAAPGDHADELALPAPNIVDGSSSKGIAPQSALVVPIKLRGQVIGTMALHETDQQRLWTAKEIELAETIAEQVALTVENLRLMDETQRRAAHERLVSEIVSRVWSSLDPDTILKTTVRELGQALGAELATVEMIGPGGDGRSSPGGGSNRPDRRTQGEA